uniref:Uncharacterized protein n=1 Tax=Rhizophora mucronata TaxID=61149 RepID=A0A2P2NT87_RHIMU
MAASLTPGIISCNCKLLRSKKGQLITNQ